MPEEIFILSIVAILFGTGITIFVLKNIFDIIKARTSRKETSSQINPQFFKALAEFKKSTERRITNLETIVSDIEEEKIRVVDSKGEIEIEPVEVRVTKESDEKDNNLRNMLNE